MSYTTAIPKVPHWAIITTSTIYIPGDERSRTNPGHGYPASTETVINYQAFTNEDEWKETVKMYSLQNKTFTAIRAIPAKISTTVNVSVESE